MNAQHRRKPLGKGGAACLVIALVVVVVAVQPASAQQTSIVRSGASDLSRHLVVGQPDTIVPMHVQFRVTNASSVYLKVLPTPWNPAFANGTPSQSGWWTGGTLIGPDGAMASGETNGSATVELGSVEDGRLYRLDLKVHVPAAALAAAQEYRLNYALAVRAPGVGQGASGGSLDPSLSLIGEIIVAAPPPPPLGEHADDQRQPFPVMVAAMIVAGVILLAGLVISISVISARRGRSPTAPAPEDALSNRLRRYR